MENSWPFLTLTVEVATYYDTGTAVELWEDDTMWGDVVAQGDKVTITIYPHPAGKQWVFAMDELMAILSQAKEKARLVLESAPPESK